MPGVRVARGGIARVVLAKVGQVGGSLLKGGGRQEVS